MSTLEKLFAAGQRIPELDDDDFRELQELVAEEAERRQARATFDASSLDDNSREQYERRVEWGTKAIELGDDGDPETQASDIISDMLTALYGPSGVYVFLAPSGLGRGRYEGRDEARAQAWALLARALESWEGDSEDYTRGA